MTRHLFGSLKIGLKRGFLNRAFLGRAPRVYINRNQGFGDADNDIAARFELHDRVEHISQVTLDLIAREKRQTIRVMFHVLGMGRHDHFHEILGLAIARLAFDQHLVNIAIIEIADRTVDQVAFLINWRRRNRAQGQFAHLFPLTLQIFVIALDLGLGALAARGADDQTRALRHLHRLRDFLQLFAIRNIGDLAADPATARGIGHQNAIASCKAEIGGQGSTFIAALLFDDLHQNDLAHFDHFLDFIFARARLARRTNIFVIIIIRDGFSLGGGGGILVRCAIFNIGLNLNIGIALKGGRVSQGRIKRLICLDLRVSIRV